MYYMKKCLLSLTLLCGFALLPFAVSADQIGTTAPQTDQIARGGGGGHGGGGFGGGFHGGGFHGGAGWGGHGGYDHGYRGDWGHRGWDGGWGGYYGGWGGGLDVNVYPGYNGYYDNGYYPYNDGSTIYYYGQ